eukprot:jgi/Bigna1/139107/aug1.48_g13815
MDPNKALQVAEFQELFVKAYTAFEADVEGTSLLEIFGQLSGIVPSAPSVEAVEEEAPVVDENLAEQEKEEAISEEKTENTSISTPVQERNKRIDLESSVFSAKKPEIKSSVRNHHASGGSSSLQLFGDSASGNESGTKTAKKMGKSKTSSNISFGDQTVATPSGDKAGIYSMVKPETCKKLAAMIYKSGRMKTVFQTFVGDPVGKSITKESFLAAATLSKTGVTAEDTDAIFSLYAKKGDTLSYAAFVRLTAGLEN